MTRPFLLALLAALALCCAPALALAAEQAPLVPLPPPAVPCPLNVTAIAAAFDDAAKAAAADDDDIDPAMACANTCRAHRANCDAACPTDVWSDAPQRCKHACATQEGVCERGCRTVEAEERPAGWVPPVPEVSSPPVVPPEAVAALASALAAPCNASKAAALAAAAGLANPAEKKSLSACESACVATAIRCVGPCPRDVFSEEGPRCRRRCKKAKLTCVRDCNTVEAEVVDSEAERRAQRRRWHQAVREALNPSAPAVAAVPPPVPTVAAAPPPVIEVGAVPTPAPVDEKTAASVIAPAMADPTVPEPIDEKTAASVVAPAVAEGSTPTPVDAATQAAVIAPAVASSSTGAAESQPAGVAEHAAMKEEAAAAAAAASQPAGVSEHAALKKEEAESAVVNSNSVPPTDLPSLSLSDADLLPLVAASVSAVPASIRESATFNLNAGGGVWRKGEPAAPQRSPSFTVSSGPRTMTVAQLPLQAKLCMLLSETSYVVKAVSMGDMFPAAASKSEWLRILQSLAMEFSGTEMYDRLNQMTVVSSSWDSALLAYKEASGQYTLYVGGHGSVANSADWLGQNLGLSRLSEFVGSTANWISNFVLGKSVADLPRQRSTRWVAAVDAAMATAQFSGKVGGMQVFGHSMSGYQGHVAAEALIAKYPRIPLEAWLLNPGGSPPLSLTPTKYSQIHHVVVPGEALETLKIGGGDPRKLSLSLANINAAKYSNVVNRAVYLHGVSLVTDDIRAFHGVGAYVELCTRPAASKAVSTDCYLRALDKSSAFAYSKDNGVYWVSNGALLPSLQCVVIPGVSMGSLRNRAAADANSREWTKQAYNDLSHNSCHWANHALVQDGAFGVEHWVDGSLPKFAKAA